MQPLCFIPLLLFSAVRAAPVGQLGSPVPVTNSAAHDPALPRQLDAVERLAGIVPFSSSGQRASPLSIPSEPQSQSMPSNHKGVEPLPLDSSPTTLSERQIDDIRRAILDVALSRRADTPSVPAIVPVPKSAAPAATFPRAVLVLPQGVAPRQAPADAAAAAPGVPARLAALPQSPAVPPTVPGAPDVSNTHPNPRSFLSRRQLRAPDYNAAGPQPASHNYPQSPGADNTDAEDPKSEVMMARGFGGTAQWAELIDDHSSSDARRRSMTSHSWNDSGKSRMANYKDYQGTHWESREAGNLSVQRLARSVRVQ